MDDEVKRTETGYEPWRETGYGSLGPEQNHRKHKLRESEKMALLLGVGLVAGIFISTASYLAVFEEYRTETTSEIAEAEYTQVDYLDDKELEYVSLPEENDWTRQIFGEAVAETDTGNLAVTGLSEYQKQKIGFQQKEFLQSASAFLKENGIETSLIYFESELSCSSDGAWVYRTTVAENPSWYMLVIFYPDFPGNYIFLLEPVETIKIPVETVVERIITTTPEPQAPARIQEIVTQPEVHTEDIKTEEKNRYDASNLTIRHMPEGLLNYVNNQYLLQYSLYEYLYQIGLYEVDSVDITGYQIDGVTRTASIFFQLDNGKCVNGTYDLDSGTYHFSL